MFINVFQNEDKLRFIDFLLGFDFTINCVAKIPNDMLTRHFFQFPLLPVFIFTLKAWIKKAERI